MFNDPDFLEKVLKFSIAWLPTILFAVLVLFGFLRGLRRGLRKSVILFIHSLVALTICIVLYALLINNEAVDAFLLNTINGILGSPTALQDNLGVSNSLTTLKGVLAEWLPSMLESSGYADIVRENAPYVLALVLLAYHIVFAILLFFVYKLLLFLFYIVYLIFYSERKRKRKVNAKYEKAVAEGRVTVVAKGDKAAAKATKKEPKPYRRRHLLGSTIGLVRGILAGIVAVSFCGAAFSVISGGNGTGGMAENPFTDESNARAYNIYKCVDEYGTQGIIKVFNVAKDKNDVPLYLYVADVVFRGRLYDEAHGVNEDILFRDELSEYVGFAKDTFNLALKYGGEEILNSSGDNSMNKITELLSNEEFQSEYREVIEKFEIKTYLKNFMLSFIDSAINHIDELPVGDSLGEDGKNVVKILFKKDYYSDKVPSDAEALSAGKTVPVLNASMLITKEDVLSAYDLLTETLNKSPEDEGYIDLNGGESSALTAANLAIPFVSGLSILSTERESEVNPVMERMYCYLENTVLKAEEPDPGYKPVSYAPGSVKWTEEARNLLNVANDALAIYSSVKPAEGEQADAVKMITDIFDEDSEKYDAKNTERFDNICRVIENSSAVGRTLSTSYMYKEIKAALAGVSQSFSMPEGIVYETRGETRGELSYLLSGVKRLCKDKEARKLLSNDGEEEKKIADYKPLISSVTETKDGAGKTIADELMDSAILRSVLSAKLVDMSEDENGYVYVPETVKEKNSAGETINIIKSDVLKEILSKAVPLVDVLAEFDNTENVRISVVIKSEAIKTLSANPLVQGTAGKLIINQFGSGEQIVIPSSLENPEAWIDGEQKGEFKKIYDFILEADFDIDGIVDKTSEITDELPKLAEHKDLLLDSDVLWYTVSKYLTGDELSSGDVKVFVPATAKVAVPAADAEKISALMEKGELKKLIDGASVLFPVLTETDGERSTESRLIECLVRNREKLFGSLVIDCTVINYFCSGNTATDLGLTVPEALKTYGTESALNEYATDSNPWGGADGELNKIIIAVDEIAGVSVSEEGKFNFSSETLNYEKACDKLKNESSLTKIYASDVLKYTVSDAVRKVIKDNPTVLKDNAKSHEGNSLDNPYLMSEIRNVADLVPADGNFDMDSMTIEKLRGYYYDGEDTPENVTEKFFLLTSIITVNVKKYEPDTITIPAFVYDENDLMTKEEIYSMLTAIKTIGINGMDDLNDPSKLGYNGVSATLRDESKLSVVYRSSIMQYTILTAVKNKINDPSSKLYDNPRAHAENDVNKPFKQSEIHSVMTLVPEGNFSIDDMTIDKLLGYYETDGLFEEKFALMTSLVSHNIGEYAEVKVPHSDSVRETLTCGTATYELIRAEEIHKLLHSLKSLGLNGMEDLTNFKNKDLNIGDAAATVADSVIMRATITANLSMQATGTALEYSAEAVDVTCHEADGFYEINKEEMIKLLTAASVITGGTVKISGVEAGIQTVAGISEEGRETILESNVFRHALCKQFDDIKAGNPYLSGFSHDELNVSVYVLTSGYGASVNRDFYSVAMCKAWLGVLAAAIAA